MEIQLSFEEELNKNQDKINDAKENLGDVEVRDGIMERAENYMRYGKKDDVFIF